MIIFKTSVDTLKRVIKHAMHATYGRPSNIKPGDIILIAQTKNTLLKGQKQIRWIMNFVSCEKDNDHLSDKIWGKHWRYIVRGENIRQVKPFNIDEIKETAKNYNGVRAHGPIEFEDKKVILKWISKE